MATLVSGDTLSLNNLAGATGFTQNSNVSLGTIKGTPTSGDNIGLSEYAIDSVDSVSGYTYAVEATNENYIVNFSGAGARFSQISGRAANFTWSVSPVYNASGTSAGYLSIGASPTSTATITVGTMNPQGASAQTSLMSNYSHTVSAVFSDGYNDHIGVGSGYGAALTKTVYSVDSYDGNSTALCILVDTPVTLADGSTIEAGDMVEGLSLQGYSFEGLSAEEGNFYNWSTDEMVETPVEVEVVNVVFSFSDNYYSINGGDIKATQDHPMLVWDSVDGKMRFKKVGHLSTNDKLIRKIKGELISVDITDITPIDETVEIVTIDVEEQDTYLINGYVTHNKGGNSHSDLAAPSAPTGLAYTAVNAQNHNITWTAVSGATAYRLQVDNNSDFSSTIIDADEYSTTTYNVVTALGSGTFYARVRAIDHGLNSNWSSTLTFTR